MSNLNGIPSRIFDLAKELVAFTNSDGGRVLLGVDDDGSVAGVTRGDLEEWIMTACRTKIRPEMIPYFEMEWCERLNPEKTWP